MNDWKVLDATFVAWMSIALGLVATIIGIPILYIISKAF